MYSFLSNGRYQSQLLQSHSKCITGRSKKYSSGFCCTTSFLLSSSVKTNNKLVDHLKKANIEIKNQSIDLRDMCTAARAPKQDLEAYLRQHPELDSPKCDLKAIISSLKAYCIRISALQGEAESLCNEMCELVNKSTSKNDPGLSEPPKTENTDPEIPAIKEHEIELEEITPKNKAEIPSDLSVQDITEYLHTQSVDFSDCFDEDSLKKRYIAVKNGTYIVKKNDSSLTAPQPKAPSTTHTGICSIREPPSYEDTSRNSTDSQGSYGSSQEKMNYGGSSQNAMMQDPYPGAERRMCDPMKYVWEVKQDICQGKGVNSSQVDIWCGPIKLEDHRRMYEYPQCQRTPMEVRMKGDTRINKNLV